MSTRTLSPEEAREMAARRHAAPPSGWSSWAAYQLYLDDPDGGRAPYREAEFAYPADTTPTSIELLSREA